MKTIEPETRHTQYACYRHPFLTPDAWSQVDQKRVVGDGAKASLVCRFACKVRDACPFGEETGSEIIASGGWFSANGKFIKPPEDMLELRQAAAYLGIKHEYLTFLIKDRGIREVKGPSYNVYVPLEDIQRLAEVYGPRHGTVARYDLHLLRGEVPCGSCAVAKDMEVSKGASLL